MTIDVGIDGSNAGGAMPPAWAPALPRQRHGMPSLVTATLIAGTGYAAANAAAATDPGLVFAVGGGLFGAIGLLAAFGVWTQNNIP